MGIIYEDALSKEISSGKLSPVYLLFGEDTFLKRHYAEAISKKAYDGDPFFNFQKFEGSADLQEVYDAVNQFPMMADRKCVVLSDYDYEHASKADFDKLCVLLSEVPEGCVFVVRFDTVEFDYKRGAKAKKLIDAAEKGQGKAVALDHRRPERLFKMLMDGANKRGAEMKEPAARYLVETAGEDISLLQNELDKLCAYVNGGEIDKLTVDTVSVKSVESSVYDYVAQITSCNISGALKMLDDMFFMHIEPMIILYTAASAYVDIYRAYVGKKAGVSVSQLAKDFGYKNRAFVLERAAKNLNRFSVKQISLSLEALIRADKELKSFSFDARTVLEELTVRLIYIISKGDSVD